MKCELCGKTHEGKSSLCSACKSPSKMLRVKTLINETIDALAADSDKIGKDGGLCFTLAGFYRLSGRLDEAVTFYHKAITKNPKPGYYHAVGAVYASKGDYRSSLEHLQKAAKDVPYYADFRSDLGAALFKSGRYEEAITEFKAALEINPKYANAHNNLSLTYRKMGKHREAEVALQQAMDLDQQHVVAEYELGRSYYSGGMFSHSEKESNISAKSIADIYMLRNDPMKACEYYLLALDIHPEYPDYHYHAGRAFAAAGKPADAKNHYEKALTINPKYALAKDALKALNL